jgi:hypothetical protein
MKIIVAWIVAAFAVTLALQFPMTAFAVDADGDGCSAIQEAGPTLYLGGGRSDSNPWDFFDLPAPALRPSDTSGVRDRAINIQDVLAVLYYIGTSATFPALPTANGVMYGSDLNGNGVMDGQEYDRTPAGPTLSGLPNGVVTISDVLVALSQVGASCV